MILYDEQGNKLEYNIKYNDNFDSGTTSKIYKINDSTCLKICPERWGLLINKDIIKTINNLDCDNMCKIDSILYNNYNEYHRIIKGYIMKYYIDSVKNIYECNTEYIINNLNDLYNTITKISKCNINMVDMMYHRNAILSNDKIILIDFDNYKIIDANATYDEVKMQNIDRLKALFVSIFKEHYKKNYNDYSFYIWQNIYHLFMENDNNDLVKNVENKIKKYKYPIDMFRQK